MEILGIGPLELLFILLIALIAVGPRDLGKAARSGGRMLNQLYKSEAWKNLSEASRSIRTLPNRLAREAALEELQQVKQEMEDELTSGIDQIKDIDLSPEVPSKPDAGQPIDNDPAPDQPTESPEGSSSKEN